MARRPANTVNRAVEVTDADTPGLPAVAAAADMRAGQLVELDAKYGNGMLYDRERVISEFNIHIGNASNSLIEAGKCVLLIREHEPRGDFDRLVEERLGLSRASAYKFMSATRRLLEMNPQTVQTFGRIGQSKLLDLMVDADNEDLDELANGGTFAGMALDEIECMTARELKAALREAREESQAKDRVLEQNQAKINELAVKAEKQKTKHSPLTESPWPEQIDGLKDDLHALGKVMDEVLSKHLTLIEATDLVYQQMDETDPAHAQYKGVVFRMAEQIERLCTLAAGLRNQFGLTLSGYIDMDKTYILPYEQE